MSYSEFWTLTVHYYPEAAKAGVRPIDKQWFSGEHEPCHYRSRSFHFNKPPSRRDFLTMVQMTYWAYHAWKDDLLPLIESGKADWPMVDYGHKAARANIIDADGLTVGELHVDRDYQYVAEGYDRIGIFVNCDDRNAVMNRIPKERRDNAYIATLDAGNRIQERISLADPSKVDVRKLIRDELTRAGFFKSKSKAKQPTGA